MRLAPVPMYFARYGAEAIPASWRAKLTMLTEITSLADQLHDQAALAS